jgi:Fibrobacter succinogenes major domain (Fib_succ_major).
MEQTVYRSGRDSTTGKKLKSQSGWKDYDGTSGNGTDAYGSRRCLLATGTAMGISTRGPTAYFWSSTERNSNVAYGMGLYYNDDSAYPINGNKYDGLSVRCLKDYKSSSSEKTAHRVPLFLQTAHRVLWSL